MLQVIDNSVSPFEITTHSNNHIMICLCNDCLISAKTNKRYKHIEIIHNLRLMKSCALCNAMTMNMAASVYGIGIGAIYWHIVKGRTYKAEFLSNEVLFTAVSKTFLEMVDIYKEISRDG